MENRDNIQALLPIISGMITGLKGLQLTGEYEEDSDGITMQCAEFPDEFENAPTLEEVRVKLVKGLKGWAESFTYDFVNMTRGHEEQIPYLIKALISTEEELLSCLKNSRLGNI